MAEKPILELHDELRLSRLMSRCDALNCAYFSVEYHEWPNTQMKENVLVVLEDMCQEANEAFDRAKREAGIAEWAP